MIFAIVALSIIVVLLLFQREREHMRQAAQELSWGRERKALVEQAEKAASSALTVALEHVEGSEARTSEERQTLLDRIQHPERVMVAPGEIKDIDPPKDAGEMAWVGQEVPEFVSVGQPD